MKTQLLQVASLGFFLAANGQELPTRPEITARAVEPRGVEPTQSGQIGVNLPPPEDFSGSVGAHTQYLEHHGEDDDVKWTASGDHITTFTATKTVDGKPTTTTITQDIRIAVNQAGGFDVLISPYFKNKLETIAKQVKPCGAVKARRAARLLRRQGDFCGSLDYVNRISTDSGISDVSVQVDEEFHHAFEHHSDSGYDSLSEVDSDGWWTASEGGSDAGDTLLENLVISSPEDAAAIAAAAGDGAAADAILASASITTGSFLVMIWADYLKNGKVSFAYNVPKESVHKITKTKTEEDKTTTTSNAACPTKTDPVHKCEEGCKPTKISGKLEPTQGLGWACSEGEHKGCPCGAYEIEIVHPYDEDKQKKIDEALENTKNAPEVLVENCDGDYSNVPSLWVSDIVKNFCKDAMESEKGISDAGNAYDIYGNKIPIMKAKAMALTASANKKRSPPVSSLKQENYEDFRFYLRYNKYDGECAIDKDDACNKAFAQMKEKRCGQNTGTNGNFMTNEASADIGCAELGWTIEKVIGTEPAEPMLKDRVCHDAKNKYDVHNGAQETWSRFACESWKDKTMKSDSEKLYSSVPGLAGDWYQNFGVSWVKDCDRTTEQKVYNPVEGEDVSCSQILRSLYTQCDNKGSGGTQQAGCLLFDFWKSD